LDAIEAGREMSSPRARIEATALRGRIASVGGRHHEGVAAAREAQVLSEGTDDLCLAGQTLADLAIVLRMAGMPEEAAAAGEAAAAKFEAKGATLLAQRVRG
jgi:hypothetical protein